MAHIARDKVDVPFLETFQDRLFGALSNLLQLKMSLPIALGVVPNNL